MRQNTSRTLVFGFVILAGAAVAAAQMVSGSKIPGFAETFGLAAEKQAGPYKVQWIESSAPGNVLWPGEEATFTFQIISTSDQPLQVAGRVKVIAYGTKGRPGDVWKPDMFQIADVGAVPMEVNLLPKGFANVTVSPRIPARFGAYGLVADLGPHGRQFITSCVRTFAASTRRVQYPNFCLDRLPLDVLYRLGVQAIRYEIGYTPTTNAGYAKKMADLDKELKDLHAHNIVVLLMVGAGPASQPLGRPRPHLDENDVMLATKSDMAWLPENDDDFQKWITFLASTYGWPKGPINAFSLWNEPWEGLSISGWGADMPRYRELFTRLASGVEPARRHAGVDVLIGGCDSSANTLDKLFADGSDAMLPWLDFCSIHYQGLCAPSIYPRWLNRQSPRGRVKIWDTESWVANTDDRVAAVVAANRAAGYDRAMGVFHGNICGQERGALVLTDANTRVKINAVHAWSVAASIGAAQHFLGQRPFRRLLFQNGLPWVMVFDGLAGKDGTPDPEDGTLVVVGDIGAEFGAANVLFRTARGLAEIAHKQQLQAKLAALPADAPATERQELEAALRKDDPLSDASMTLPDGGGKFTLYDFYGNPVGGRDGKIVVPLDGRGFFLRGDGSRGSFAALVQAVKDSHVEGIEPLAVAAHDMTARIEKHPVLRLSLTNVLNRPVRGSLSVTLGGLKIEPAAQTLALDGNETKEVEIKIQGGSAAANNTYLMSLIFDAGNDGKTVHEEDVHVNVIARRTITVDGKLDDWQGVPPQTVRSEDAAPTLAETAWFPMLKFEEAVRKGFAIGYLAYDQDYFYFAAKIADDTPEEGMPRFETRNDDEFFYPPVAYFIDNKPPQAKKDGKGKGKSKNPSPDVAAAAPDVAAVTPQQAVKTALAWPEGVRRFSYRKRPELPAGNVPNHDNVQIAFNVFPFGQNGKLSHPPGTMPRFTHYFDTDYEYALNPVAARYGGGFEIWRLLVPGMPRKHFYPRQPASPKDGPVKSGKLMIIHDGGTRIVEAALPWSELPDVKQALDAGRTVKFSFRVNDNGGRTCLELARYRSVSKRNNYTFHCDWVEHWANELEFAGEQ